MCGLSKKNTRWRTKTATTNKRNHTHTLTEWFFFFESKNFEIKPNQPTAKEWKECSEAVSQNDTTETGDSLSPNVMENGWIITTNKYAHKCVCVCVYTSNERMLNAMALWSESIRHSIKHITRIPSRHTLFQFHTHSQFGYILFDMYSKYKFMLGFSFNLTNAHFHCVRLRCGQLLGWKTAF